jgi:hypothetical protein
MRLKWTLKERIKKQKWEKRIADGMKRHLEVSNILQYFPMNHINFGVNRSGTTINDITECGSYCKYNGYVWNSYKNNIFK